jgi:hypothetical protein
MTSKDNKFGKKKSGNKFNREKTFASSEADILRADKKQEQYNEERQNERHQRRVIAGLEKDKEKGKQEKDNDITSETNVIKYDINKHDIKKFGTAEEAEKYLYMCHTCGTNIDRGREFCGDKCKEYVAVYNYPCKWQPDCVLCKTVNRKGKNIDEDYENDE